MAPALGVFTDVLMIFLVLSTWPTPAFFQIQGDPEVEGAYPSLNVTFNSRTMNLSWDCPENMTEARCLLRHEETGKIIMKVSRMGCSCTFTSMTLHAGATLEVQVTAHQRHLRETLVYANTGVEGTAARNFSCFIYDADFLNCTWARGPVAPVDTQYFLFLQDSRSQGKRETECPGYLKEAGTNLGCHLHGLSRWPFYTYFLVNGSSRHMHIQFFDAILSTKEIERFSPPANTSVHCNESHCLIQWLQPKTQQRLSYLDFQYQLDIQKEVCGVSSEVPKNMEPGSWNPLVEVSGASENKYNFPSLQPRVRHWVRVRAADARVLGWSPWSQPVHFGSDTEDGGLLRVSLLVVLGTLVCTLVLGFLAKRFFKMCGLLSPIPHVKDKLNDQQDLEHQVAWDEFPVGSGKCENEEVLTVQDAGQALGARA
nr:granulocyte-macrophage colony-stimulating factor receptor subunit alpha isoform X1 [Oryctolagus cuniculus]XP_008249542.1 granulocyte-macrophage colony-stimulating factor receptor subunit alpha isoform X1 [Oryctolagus cuniculus]XP_008249543.1 granulocyte-macrophage colony-stimulating factor receptor subunit alpha isoform X1 [Oryctolagus cuniculus]